MNIYLIIILAIIIAEYTLSLVVEILNVRNIDPALPEEFRGFYDESKYSASQEYLKENTIFKLVKSTIFTAIVLVFILVGGFNVIDNLVRGPGQGPILSGLIFAGILVFGMQILDIPFSVYRTFVIEERYGFNKTTPKTFILDIIKSWVLTIIIGGIIVAGILWFFGKTGALAWLYCWAAVAVFQIVIAFIAPVVIMPLFNKFVPLEDGELKKAIERYADSENFRMKGIFKMDGSKRSAKSNAFFVGFGGSRRIALYDTLINNHTVDEIVSVLAHEVGHYKKRHIIKGIVFSIVTSALMFYILSLFINNPGLFAAFKMEHVSVYASLFFFGFLYSPINLGFSVLANVISRKHEYEADAYEVDTFKKPEASILALKKLAVNHLANLTPHRLKVFMQYSHPPLLQRIQAIKRRQAR
ncbi:M48 family metallopeptidase [Candidatus Omnitrophota bacterium]